MGDVLRKDALALIASIVVSLLAVLLMTGGLAHLLLGDVVDAKPGGATID
jgi:putative effector of murein hydrolase LrgA (UPF0299 family)